MFERSADQELFEDTTRRFLESRCPLSKLRDLAGSKAGFEPEYWREGAELGWTSLVVPEEAGGGSVSGDAVHDLVLLAYQFGLHAAPGPLGPTNLVAATIGRWGTQDQRAGFLTELLSGDSVAAWALAEPRPNDRLGRIAFDARTDGDSVVLTGTKVPVEAGSEAGCLLVTARHQSGLSQFLLRPDTPGLSLTPLQGVDMTRRFARADFDQVRVPLSSMVGEAGAAGPAVEWLTDLAVIIQLAEMVGAMQWAFDTTLDWALNRYSFGRPLASYQEIKHRFADMKMWLEASYAITSAAARSVQEDAPDRAALVSAGKMYVGRQGGELLQDCVQLHGGIGVTFDHDLHLFLRRVTTDIPTFGSPTEHAVRISEILGKQADILETQENR
jgi:alkylation response protein AidB-like acyl-CoA dehydrogenase